MMNKKGLSLGRIMLYILFISVLGFIIYSLILTYKEIKKKEPATQATTKIEVGSRFVAPTTYNPINDMEGLYYTFMDSGFGSGNGNPFYPDVNSSVNPVPMKVNNSIYRGSILTQTNNPYVLRYGSMLQYNNLIARDNYSGSYTDNGYFDEFSYGFGFIKCNIIKDNFKFSISGSNARSTYSLFYISDSIVNSNGYYVDFMRIDNLQKGVQYNMVDIMPSADATSTRIVAFGFGFYAPSNYNPVTANYYLNTGFDDLDYTASIDISITFVGTAYSQDTQDAYDAGYEKGYRDAEISYESAYNSLIEQANIDANTIAEQASLLDTRQTIINSLQAQLNTSHGGFKQLFFTMADIPFRTISNALGFEFWGVNLFNFFVGVLTALGIIWLIKKIL